MERIDQFSFYKLAKSLQTLASYVGDVHPSAVVWELFDARAAISSLLRGKPIPIGVSRTAAADVQQSIETIYRFHFTEDPNTPNSKFKYPSKDDAHIDDWLWNRIRTSLSAFEIVFSAEMAEATTYFVPSCGIYSTPALIDSADQSFPKEVQSFIPDKAKEDWRAAGRCLAFNLLSASGFHVARAVEGTIEAYYQLFSAKPGATLRSWYDYYDELDKIAKSNPTPAPAQKTLIEFDQMRQDYRNPIMHPRVVLDEADARMLFNNGESLIIAMAAEIRAAQRTQGGVQPALGLVQPATVSP